VALEDQLNDEILERRQEIHTAVVAILGRKHHFQIGPPGTAKSLLIERITKRIQGLGDDGYFRWLLTNYTTPEELFGGPDFTLLRERGIYKRVTERKAPRAKFVFMDEMFKGSSAILNTNLTLMNERLFFNADEDPQAPLITLFAASNEMPQGDALWALWDRLHFRHQIKPMQESSSFISMLTNEMDPNPDPAVRMEDIYAAHKAVDEVKVPTEIIEALKGLRDDFHADGLEGVTERRWVESVGIIRAEAFLNGRSVADIEDMRPLMHVLWADLDHQKIVRKKVLELANPIDKEASDILDRLIDLEYEFSQIVEDGDNPKAVAKQAIEVHHKVMKAAPKIKELQAQSEASGRKSEYLAQAKAKFVQLNKAVMTDGFHTEKAEF
jgi:MoxR-like ATPase